MTRGDLRERQRSDCRDKPLKDRSSSVFGKPKHSHDFHERRSDLPRETWASSPTDLWVAIFLRAARSVSHHVDSLKLLHNTLGSCFKSSAFSHLSCQITSRPMQEPRRNHPRSASEHFDGHKRQISMYCRDQVQKICDRVVGQCGGLLNWRSMWQFPPV